MHGLITGYTNVFTQTNTESLYCAGEEVNSFLHPFYILTCNNAETKRSYVWRLHEPADPEPDSLIMSQWTSLNVHASRRKLVNGHSSSLSSQLTSSQLHCASAACSFPPTSPPQPAVSQPSLGPVLFAYCWMTNIKHCLQILLILGSLIRPSQNTCLRVCTYGVHCVFVMLIYWQIIT